MSLGGKSARAPAGLERHPCIGESAFGNSGRIHLPVSPACNIQCRFCSRKMSAVENAPGVTARCLTPRAAADRVDWALTEFPEITVAGIAGPGDPLATDHALRTFEIIHGRHPELVLCMSTNGLELPARADALWGAGVRSITVTVNSVNPEALACVVPRVATNDRVAGGVEGAKILIARQLEGISKVSSLGGFVKVNFVLIPEVNDREIGEVARVARDAGARRINIIPLIPQAGFAGRRPPGCAEIERARAAAEACLPVFRHCQRCRADACGIPGRPGAAPGGEFAGPPSTFSHG